MSGIDHQSEAFVVRGSVRERETGRPLPDLIVRAFDRDWIADDKVGYSSSNQDGEFEIRFGLEDFQDFIEKRPDLYLRVYDREGTRLDAANAQSEEGAGFPETEPADARDDAEAPPEEVSGKVVTLDRFRKK